MNKAKCIAVIKNLAPKWSSLRLSSLSTGLSGISASSTSSFLVFLDDAIYHTASAF